MGGCRADSILLTHVDRSGIASDQSAKALPHCLNWRPAVDLEVSFGTNDSYPRVVRKVIEWVPERGKRIVLLMIESL
jgi:hypothetical protein